MKIKTIKATSRLSLKVGEAFYTFEFGEEREVNIEEKFDEFGNITNQAEIDLEREKIWNDINKQVDKQAEEVVNSK